MSKIYTEAEAEIHGRRRVCYREGHRLLLPDLATTCGGIQGITAEERRRGGSPAVCDEISCLRCDVVFTASYAPLGTAS